MFKSKALFVVAILVISLAAIASSCAPAAPAATPAAPAATPAAPAATPAAPAATPAAPAATPAAPAATTTHSWGDSTTYTNDTVGFTVDYPAKWTTADIDDAAGGELQKFVANTSDPAADFVTVYAGPAATDLSAAVISGLNSSPTFQKYKVKATQVSSTPFTLTSGSVTNATATEVTATIVMYHFYFYNISVTKGNTTVSVTGGTTGGGNAKKQIQEICQTISFK